jgi:hypothetical protein
MPKLLYFVACERILLGDEEKTTSLISLLEQIKVPKPPENVGDAQAGLQWRIVSAWHNLPEDEGKRYEQRTWVVSPNGAELMQASIEFAMTNTINHRNTVKVFGFPLVPEGEYLVKLSIREVGSNNWVDIADYPIAVMYVAE